MISSSTTPVIQVTSRGFLYEPEQHHPQHVNHRGDDDEAGAEEVQAADDAAER